MDYEVLFTRLDEKLEAENLTLRVHCIGGFVLEYYGLKATADIDAFYESSDKVEKIIREIGDEFHIGKAGEPWLNNHISNLMSQTNHPDAKTIYSTENLTVTISSLESVLEDKIIAARAKDRDDITALLKKLNKRDLESILKVLEYDDGTTDISLIFDAYIRAFGEKDFDNYLKSHPDMEKFL
jgi:hypothetical protein